MNYFCSPLDELNWEELEMENSYLNGLDVVKIGKFEGTATGIVD